MDALDVLMGSRADVSVIRSEAELARVEGTSSSPAPNARLPSKSSNGKNCWMTPITSHDARSAPGRSQRGAHQWPGRRPALLKELGELLVDIHGQSEHLSLLNVRAHLGLLTVTPGSNPTLRFTINLTSSCSGCGQ